jgi:hypothetical protein
MPATLAPYVIHGPAQSALVAGVPAALEHARKKAAIRYQYGCVGETELMHSKQATVTRDQTAFLVHDRHLQAGFPH